jgi:hypothetical protein
MAPRKYVWVESTGYPNQMIHWGASGIASTTENGEYDDNNAPADLYPQRT